MLEAFGDAGGCEGGEAVREDGGHDAGGADVASLCLAQDLVGEPCGEAVSDRLKLPRSAAGGRAVGSGEGGHVREVTGLIRENFYFSRTHGNGSVSQ
jgi:hypothetical protein